MQRSLKMMQRTNQTNSQPTLKSQMRLLYGLKSTRQMMKITCLTRVRQVVQMKRRRKRKRKKRRRKLKRIRSGM